MNIPHHSTLRFLLPTFYLYTIAGMWVLKMLVESDQKGAKAAVGAVLIVTIWWGFPQSIFSLGILKETNVELAEVTRIVDSKVPDGAILIAQNQIQQQLDITGQWKLADERIFLRRDETRIPYASIA